MYDAKQEAELFAMLAISKARDMGRMKKRNILKMDHKVNLAVLKYLQTDGRKFKITLPETLASHRVLPNPFTTSQGGPAEATIAPSKSASP